VYSAKCNKAGEGERREKMVKRIFSRVTDFLLVVSMIGIFLAGCGPSDVTKREPPSEASSPETGSTPVSPATTAESAPPERTPAGRPSKSVGWRNTQYRTDCGGTAPQPFTVNVHDGEGHASASGEHSQYGYDIKVIDVATGQLTGDARLEGAVFLGCHPGMSNSQFAEVQVFTDGPDGRQQLARLRPPALTTRKSSFEPLFTAEPFLIQFGVLFTGVYYWTRSDPHCCPSIYRILTWQWDGSRFVAEPQMTYRARPAGNLRKGARR
jgi:hypothetical protein